MFKKAKEWFEGVYYRKPILPSYETFINIHEYMSLNVLVNVHNKLKLVEMYRLLAETVIWGDRNDPMILDYFINNNTLIYFVLHMCQSDMSMVVTYQILQALNIIFENIRDISFINNMLSSNCINIILVMTRNETNEEVMALYVSLLKTISFKVDTSNLCFLFDSFNNDIPLLSKAVMLYSHHESMVRIAVRTITFNILKYHSQPNLNVFLNKKLAFPLFLYLIECVAKCLHVIHEKVVTIDNYTVAMYAPNISVKNNNTSHINECNNKSTLIRKDSISLSDRIHYKQQITAISNQIEHQWYHIGEHIEYISDLLSVLPDNLSIVLKNMFINKLILGICIKNIKSHMVYNFFIAYICEMITDLQLKGQIIKLLLVDHFDFSKIFDINLPENENQFYFPSTTSINSSDQQSSNKQHSFLAEIIEDHSIWNQQIVVSFSNFKQGNVRLKDFIEEINYNYKNYKSQTTCQSTNYEPSLNLYYHLFDDINDNQSLEYVKNDFLSFLTNFDVISDNNGINFKLTNHRILLMKYIVLMRLCHELLISREVYNLTIEVEQTFQLNLIKSCAKFLTHFINDDIRPLWLVIDLIIFLLDKNGKCLIKQQFCVNEISSLIKDLIKQTHMALKSLLKVYSSFFDAFIVSLHIYNKNLYHSIVLEKILIKQFANILMIPISTHGIDRRIFSMFLSNDMRDQQFYRTILLTKMYLLLENIAENYKIKDINEQLCSIINFSVSLPEVNSSIDLTNKEITYCRIIQNNIEKRQFLVVFPEYILIVDSDTGVPDVNVGWGIIKQAISLYDTYVDSVSSDNYSFSLQVTNKKLNTKDFVTLYFDDYIRCMLCKQRIERMISSLNESLKESISMLFND